ncbi:BspA family leucine-rich repeat surface protein [Leuconostoc falkenbergense]|uniref:BspA family leucine-rich repeat surface protein n=1 Tax=Leuconostoc falkenbergense TaxID=2766470 RepID=UPI0021A982FB|nr:BspA family leucine-rich repeat surface protein [Leuconostoc falkenbergense]MCT4377775.1 BspA family leucine-rich repeat surface protein [Leuconostoc falkenbergense]MDV8951800.1 BspA family leucine-rich repeat surface protein [Leuconostoc falkenbergense]
MIKLPKIMLIGIIIINLLTPFVTVSAEGQVSTPPKKATTNQVENKRLVKSSLSGNIGGVPFTLDTDTGELVFTGGTGTFNDNIEEALYYNYGIDTSFITSIRFEKNPSTQALVKTTGIDWLFAGLTNLETFNGENLDVSNVSSMYNWFSANPKLKNVDLSSWNVANIQSLSGFFLNCPKLESVNLTGWTNTNGNALNMTDMFATTSKLETLVMTNVDLQNITNMNGMFTGTGLKEVDLSGLNTSNVTNMANVFSNANKLEKVDLSTWDTQNVTSTLNMFTGTTSLWQIKLGANTVFKGKNPNYTAAPAAGTTIIDDGNTYTTLAAEWQIVGTGSPHQPNGAYVTTTEMYEDTPRPVTYVWAHTAPSELISGYHGDSPWTLDPDTGELIYGSGTFQDAQTVAANLESYDVDPALVTSIKFLSGAKLSADSSYLFASFDYYAEPTLSNLTNFDATNLDTSDVINMSAMFNRTTVTSLDLHEWNVTKVTDFSDMFQNSNSLTTLDLSDWGKNRTASSVNMYQMFFYARALTNLNITDFKTDNVTNIRSLFEGSGVESLDLSNWNVDQVTNMSNVFLDASALTTLNLSNWGENRTALSVNMGSLLGGTSSLTNLTLDNFKTKNVTNMQNMFYGSGVTSLDLHEWNVDKVTSFTTMFSDATSLASLDLSNWGSNRTASSVAMNSMFNNTSALSNITLTNFKTTNVTNMQSMFNGSGITSIDMSGWDLSKTTNVKNMFLGTTKLWKITLDAVAKFPATPNIQTAPAAGTTIPGTSYVTSNASWQAVGTGTEFNPKGSMVSTIQMYADRTEPVTYVWANTALTPALSSISSLTFGSLGAHDFFNGNSPLATNMATGSVALKDLDNSTTYNVNVAQTSDWTTDGESATIAKSNLKIKYGANDLSTGASSFWSGTSATATKSIAFNHDTNKNFSIWLNPSTVLDTALLGKQLESELTWTLSETP